MQPFGHISNINNLFFEKNLLSLQTDLKYSDFILNIAHLEKKKNTKENDPDLVQKLSKVAFDIHLVHFLGCIFS